MATKVDEYVGKVEKFEAEFEFDLGKLHDDNIAEQQRTLDKSREVSRHNTTDPLAFQREFEAFNEHLGLYFTQSAYDNFVSLYNLVVGRLKKQGTP
jgi:hypothetical protein